MAKQTQETDEPSHQPETCDPCSFHTKTCDATTYCTVCEENLCELCTKAHSTRKMTREHKPIPIQEKKTHLMNYCDSCSENPKEACKYCELCEENLCFDCVNAHAKRMATKNHVLADLATIQQSDECDLFCDICLQTGKKVKAEYFCQQCTELLCIECNNVHKNIKATPTHKPIPAADISESNNIDESMKCEPCGLSNNLKPAVKYCEQCKEFLCDDCATRHGLQKSTFPHQLNNASDIELNIKCCDVCTKCGEVNPAILFCKVCSEALCDKCVRSHKNQKATGSHELLELKEQSTDETAQETKIYALCEKRNLHKIAQNYCITCEIYLCGYCKGNHVRQKVNKNHEITDATIPEKSNIKLCIHCLNVEEEVPAWYYCTECHEELCAECTDNHKVQKPSKHHKTIDINDAPNPDIEECAHCKDDDKICPAVKYCTKCNEYLCEDCCKFHKRYKQTMNHELKEIEEFKKEKRCDCDSCLFSDNKEVKAESFC